MPSFFWQVDTGEQIHVSSLSNHGRPVVALSGTLSSHGHVCAATVLSILNLHLLRLTADLDRRPVRECACGGNISLLPGGLNIAFRQSQSCLNVSTCPLSVTLGRPSPRLHHDLTCPSSKQCQPRRRRSTMTSRPRSSSLVSTRTPTRPRSSTRAPTMRRSCTTSTQASTTSSSSSITSSSTLTSPPRPSLTRPMTTRALHQWPLMR